MLRPRFVARCEIDRRAAEMVSRHGDRAAEVCHTNAHRAWCDGDGFEVALWRRIGKAIGKRT